MNYYDDYPEKHDFSFRFDSNDGRNLEMNCSELFLDDILARFSEFLRGCGYMIEGQLEVVSYNEEDCSIEQTTTETEEKFDFGNIPNNNWPFGSLAPSTTSYAWDPESDSEKVYSSAIPTSEK